MLRDLAALLAVFLWSSLATLGVLIGDLPPLLTTGIGLLIGSAISVFMVRGRVWKLRTPLRNLGLGVFGLFGYHFALFAAFQTAPIVQANLVNYLWPVLIVLFAPVVLGRSRPTPRIAGAAAIGFLGAGIAVVSGQELSAGFEIGYLYALIAAGVWATYSLGIARLADFPVSQIGVFGFVSGILALASHLMFEPPVEITSAQWVWLLLLGLGPLGGAFYLWSYALKSGDAQRIGLIAFLTPLISTVLLLTVSGQELSWLLAASAALILGASWLGAKRG